MSEELICMDPSCFTSLEKLRDAKHVLNEIRKENPSLKVCVPTKILTFINYSPEQKFRELPLLIDDWINAKEPGNIKFIDDDTKNDYVFVMREFLELHSPIEAKEFVGKRDKIGNNSIHLKDLREKFGSLKADILFELMCVSWEYKSKIIAFGGATFSMMQEVGTHVKRGASSVKREMKERARIRTPLIFTMLFMEQTGMLDFIGTFDIVGLPVLQSLFLLQDFLS
jgi:hypothetical protein